MCSPTVVERRNDPPHDSLHQRTIPIADLLERLRSLTPEELQEAVGDSLTGTERGSLMRRRDRLVRHFDALIDQRGEGAVVIR